MPHERIVLCTQDTFFALGVSLRDQLGPKMLADIVDNSRRFWKNSLFFRTSRRNTNNRRSSEWMHGFEVIASTEFFVSSEDLELILQVKLFEQPHCPLASRLLEPGLRLGSLSRIHSFVQ